MTLAGGRASLTSTRFVTCFLGLRWPLHQPLCAGNPGSPPPPSPCAGVRHLLTTGCCAEGAVSRRTATWVPPRLTCLSLVSACPLPCLLARLCVLTGPGRQPPQMHGLRGPSRLLAPPPALQCGLPRELPAPPRPAAALALAGAVALVGCALGPFRPRPGLALPVLAPAVKVMLT